MTGKAGYKDEETLQELYYEERLSQAEIAERFGVSQATISNWMARFDFTPRETSTATRMAVGTIHPYYQTMNNGYERVECREPRGGMSGVLVHRLVAVAEYGLSAVKDNDVHHQNNIPFDNRPSNLKVINPVEHRRHHGQKASRDEQGRFDGSRGGGAS